MKDKSELKTDNATEKCHWAFPLFAWVNKGE
jgi:hypothetical protein